MSEPIVLSYHDSVIRESDMEILRGPHWLNDSLIQFYLDYLEHEAFPGYNLAMVGPDVAQFARLCPEPELAAFLAPLRLPERRGALFVVNDCERPDAPGGTHWSLLVAAGKRLVHYDSLGDGNQRVARQMGKRLATVLGGQGKVEDADCGRQRNGHDCGLFALIHAEQVCGHLVEGDDLLHVPVSQDRVDTMRSRMISLITQLAERQRRAEKDGSGEKDGEKAG